MRAGRKGQYKKKVSGTANPLSLFAFLNYVLFISCLLLGVSSAAAQVDDDDAPPPSKLIRKDERKRLDAENDPKSRTKLLVDMMRLSVEAAEKFNSANDFDGIFRELGHFRGLLDYSLLFLERQNLRDDRSLDNYKRLELCLRTATPRIETIRREIPLRYEAYVRALLQYIREARTKANESLLGDTVLPADRRP